MTPGSFGPTERLGRAELDELQLSLLRVQLERVRTVPFFARQLAEAGLDPAGLTSLRQFTERVPWVEKADFLADQEAAPPFGTRLTVPDREIARMEITSGTSGLGQEVYGLAARDIATIGRMGAWLFARQGLEPGDKVAITLPLGYLSGPWGGHWAAEQLGCSVHHLGLAPDTESKLRFLQRFGINGLFTPTPTYLMRLARTAQAMNLDPAHDLPALKVAWLAGESYPVEWAGWISDQWGGLALAESYGSTQGAFAGSCEYGVAPGGRRGHLHNMDWNVLLEVIDPATGEPVQPGEWGEAVLTTLVRRASPVLRFRTRDRVRLLPHDGCLCGRRTVAIEAGTIGRYDDMIKVKAMNIWPRAVDDVILPNPVVDDYFAEVGLSEAGHEYVRVRVAFHDQATAAERKRACAELTQRLHAITNVTMELVEAERADLPQFEYKARRWLDNRDRDLRRVSIPEPAEATS